MELLVKVVWRDTSSNGWLHFDNIDSPDSNAMFLEFA